VWILFVIVALRKKWVGVGQPKMPLYGTGTILSMHPSDLQYHKVLDTALRILARREHTRHELREKLLHRNFEDAAVDRVLAECRRLDYLNDERAAAVLLRSLKRKGVGIHRVRREFRRRGLTGDAFDAFVSRGLPEEEEIRIAQRLAAKKKGGDGCTAMKGPGREEIYRFLLSRGFSQAVIARVLRS